jgi:predicted GTPase
MQERIQHAATRVRDYIAAKGSDQLRARFSEWKGRFQELFEQTKQRPEVAISLVGGTGAGKSTLLNALVGARILPVSNMRACTAAVTEIAYADGPFKARVEFVPRETWEQEIRLLQDDLRDAQLAADNDGAPDVRVEILRAVRDKLLAVYKPAENADPAEFDPFQLIEPAEIREALDAGHTNLESANAEEFRKRVAHFLDSRHRYWPIVKAVTIRGPFSALQDGAKIIDLPGLNDPNEAREQVTKNHLKACRFVWIVFNIKRALTKDTMALMQSEDFLRQIVMDGRADSLTLVGTAADDLDLETAIEEFNLTSNAEIPDVVAARNREVRKVVESQLEELACRVAEMANEQRDTANKLADKLKQSQVFTVSAREYLRITGVTRTNASGFTEIDQTELPALRRHMQAICNGFGLQSHLLSLNRQLMLLGEEIVREGRAQQAALQSRVETTERQQQEMRAAGEAAQTFLERDLEHARERLVDCLDGAQGTLAERVSRAVDRARHELQDTLTGWAGMHWATMKAVCRRGGTHVGSRGRNDFPADLAKPILNSIAFAWSDYFGEKLDNILERSADNLLRLADDYRRRLLEGLGNVSALPKSLQSSIAQLFETTQKVVKERVAQTAEGMDSRLEREQRTLYESIPEQLRANMQEAFQRAADERGTGMKMRMVDTLSDHARRVAAVMFNDARESLLNGVRQLNDWLTREFAKMADTVRRNASDTMRHLMAAEGEVTQTAIQRELDQLQQFVEMVESELGRLSSV